MKLTHWFFQRSYNSKPRSMWTLSFQGETLLETGSSVRVLRELKRRNLPLPEILGGPSAFDREYKIEWGCCAPVTCPKVKGARV